MHMFQRRYTIQDFLEVCSASNPSFNFDGSKICYLSNISGMNQIYVVSSGDGQAEQITSYEDPVSFASFSPVKDEIIFGKSHGGDEQTQLYLYSLETKTVRALTDNPKVKYNLSQYSRDGRFIAYSHNERNGTDFDVCIMDMESGAVECVYDKGGSCYAGSFSPKSSYLIIRKQYSNLDVDLYLLSLKDKSLKLLTPHTGSAYFGSVSWLPDESAFFTVSNMGRDLIGLCRFDMAKRELSFIMTPKWDVDGAAVSFDGKLLLMTVNEDGYQKLNMFKADSLERIPLKALSERGTAYSARFSKDSKRLAMSMGDSRHTTDVWTYSLEDHECTQITHSRQGVPPEELVEPELFRYKSFDGLTIPAFLYLPKNIKAGEEIPVVINIHGGPESQYKPSFATLTQFFVYQGYAVIAPNVRGSSGYGKKYLALDDIEKRLDSVHDLAALYDHMKTIEQLDCNKIALMGASYGGYMVLAGLAFYPDLWSGGIDIVGISNFITFLEKTAPYRRAMREPEYGSLEKNRDLLHSISPINHIQNIRAPLFIIHGANDPRVPLNEAEQIVNKLKDLGREAELLVYADEGHGLSRLKNRLDAYPKVADFLKKVFAK